MYNIVELFSGIGSQAKALKNLGLQINLVGTCEWDVHAIIAYDLIHNSVEVPEAIQNMSKEELLKILEQYTFSNSGKEPLAFTSLKTYSLEVLQHLYLAITRNHNFVDVSSLKGNELPANIDIMTYSFPCQDLSNVGAFHGYNKGIDKDSGSRSSLLWQVGRILSEMKESQIPLPRTLLMENVPTLLSSRHLPNFKMWIEELNQLGYISKYFQLNASDFGLPQNRPRLLMLSVYVGNNQEAAAVVNEYFDATDEAKIVADYRESAYFHQYTVRDLLRINYENPKIRAEAIECVPNDTVSRKKIWDENPQIVLDNNVFNEHMDVVRTITTKQDRNPNSGNLYFDCGLEGKSKFRYLTPRECLLFMGFTDEDFRKLKTNKMEFHKGDALFSRDKVIRMAGNSIPVKMLEGIFLQAVRLNQILDDFYAHTFKINAEYSEKKRCAKTITKYMFAHRIRCRKPGGQYPSMPDIVFPKCKTVIFLRDCLQHNHGCKQSLLPAKNRSFWEQRIERIQSSDAIEYARLENSGWHVIVVWKCELDESHIGKTLKKIEHKLRHNYTEQQKEVS